MWEVIHPIAIGFENICRKGDKTERKYSMNISTYRLPVLRAISIR
jgi:hypothetical protein